MKYIVRTNSIKKCVIGFLIIEKYLEDLNEFGRYQISGTIEKNEKNCEKYIYFFK